ncbi:FUSC family protein [Corynebacterium sp. TAE3-ERU12]|uniref:FUSC family protein n=1 Tax=Corynebacterium sp. TAE3-ERU12 TaxID=2849491 RepID=UPI001C469199|nr:FUSC family protein [Corynebacterium sp. TAE3-ERU12]MBV7295991.1 FUSC family protein [Corynebacterium sp. TAE3-ERU12]
MPEHHRPATDYASSLTHPASRASAALRRRARPRTRFLHGIQEVRSRWLLIVQASLAAGLAYFVAKDVLGHLNPFFAPMAAFISMNVMMYGPRIRFSVELVIGATLGVGIGDFIIGWLGPGTWQLTVGVLVAMTVGVFVNRGPLVVNQAASSAVLIATIIPPGSATSYQRMIDALVGGLVGIAVMSIIPRNPVAESKRSIARVIDLMGAILYDVARGLENDDADRIRTALQVARASQGTITHMSQVVADGNELAKVSPVWWGRRAALRSLRRVVNPVDNGIRNTRVLARRAITVTEDRVHVRPEIIEMLAGAAECAYMVRHIVDDVAELPAAPAYGAPEPVDSLQMLDSVTPEETIRRLKMLAATMGMENISGATLSEIMIFGQCRSIVVDLLQVCGMSRLSAVAMLPPTVEQPAMPPEVWGSPINRKKKP